MNVRTDLAVELVPSKKNTSDDKEGYTCEIKETNNYKTTIINVKDEKKVGKPKGKYITVETSNLEFTDGRVEAVEHELLSLIPKEGPILVVGLGNRDITADALGPIAISKILATRHLKGEMEFFEKLREVSTTVPGVLGQTGIEVSDILKGIKEIIKPVAIITIDALAARDLDRLGCTIQITDTGVSPGSGIGNRRSEINEKTMGIPVISIGVPTVIAMANITEDKKYENLIVTPKDIDLLTERAARLVSLAINKSLFRSLSTDDIIGLCG
ncbi:MAG: GPR endopeptidase [Oscillospiraceae bacterium]|nr:GPR endopeptidase [Oscillospiraceae bacterium]